MDMPELIDVYCQAWSEPEEEQRAELLSRVWARGATYTDPRVHLQGAAELLDHISQVLARRPGSKVQRTSLIDQHHGIARFTWQAVEANGNKLLEGLDLAFVSADGTKIERIIGFFGPLRAMTA